MQRLLLTLALCAVFLLGRHPLASAQTATPDDRRGSNYDPPPQPKPKPAAPQPAAAPEAGKPLIPLQELDWTDKNTWLKLALFVGSIVLARRAFRQMKDD